MQVLPLPETVALFVTILCVLVVAHELGHFAAAKWFEVAVPEFGLGLPPRLVTLWRSSGWIRIQGKRIGISKELKLPEGLRPGDYIRYATRTEKAFEILSELQVVEGSDAGSGLASQVQSLDRGTIYTINALPLGGFVRMKGENDPGAADGLGARAAWQRTIVLVAGVTMNSLLALIAFFILEAAFPQPVTGSTTRIVGFTSASPLAQTEVRAGDLAVAIDGVNVTNNYAAMVSQLESHCGRQITLGLNRFTPGSGIKPLALTVTPQPINNLQCGLGVYVAKEVGQRISEVRPGSLGSQIGLRPGDGLVRVGDFQLVTTDGSSIPQMHSSQELSAYVEAHSKVPTRLPVQVIRDGVPLAPLHLTIPEGIDPQQATLGLTLNSYLSLPEASVQAFNQMGLALSLVPRTFAGIASGLARGQDIGVGGPIRIAQAVAEGTPSGGLPFIVSLFGLLSLNLAVMNLLPFPGLDGGRLVFVLLEALRGGRRINPRLEGIAHLGGLIVLLTLTLLVSYSDLIRLLAGKSAFGP